MPFPVCARISCNVTQTLVISPLTKMNIFNILYLNWKHKMNTSKPFKSFCLQCTSSHESLELQSPSGVIYFLLIQVASHQNWLELTWGQVTKTRVYISASRVVVTHFVQRARGTIDTVNHFYFSIIFNIFFKKVFASLIDLVGCHFSNLSCMYFFQMVRKTALTEWWCTTLMMECMAPWVALSLIPLTATSNHTFTG